MSQGLAEGLSLQGRFGGGQIDPGSELMKGYRIGQGIKQKQDQNKARYNDLVGIKDPAQVHALYRDQYKQTGTDFLHELADAKQKNPRLSQSQANEIAFKYKEKLARLEKQSKNAQSLQDELIKNDRLGYRDVGQAIATGDWNKLKEYHKNPLSGVQVSDQGDLYVDAEKPQNLSEYVDKNVHDQKMFSGFYTQQGKRIKGDAYGDTYQYSMPDEKVQEQAQLSFTPQVYRQVINQSPDEVQQTYDNMLRDASEQGMDTRDPMVQQQLQQAAAFNVYQTKYVKPRQVPVEREVRKRQPSQSDLSAGQKLRDKFIYARTEENPAEREASKFTQAAGIGKYKNEGDEFISVQYAGSEGDNKPLFTVDGSAMNPLGFTYSDKDGYSLVGRKMVPHETTPPGTPDEDKKFTTQAESRRISLDRDKGTAARVATYLGFDDVSDMKRFLDKQRGKYQKTITPEEFNKQWAKLTKGQTIVGPDGVTYTKK